MMVNYSCWLLYVRVGEHGYVTYVRACMRACVRVGVVGQEVTFLQQVLGTNYNLNNTKFCGDLFQQQIMVPREVL